MKKFMIASVLTTATVTVPAVAQTSTTPALTANIGVFSSYRFRGIDQTFGKPALQGGIDYTHSSGWYVGNCNSNVSSGAGFPDGNLEMDFYGGFKKTWGDWGLDVGGIVYFYPGSEARVLGTNADSGAVNNKELYIGGSWRFVSLKYSYAVDDYFSLRGVDSTGASTGERTRGTSYLDLNANYDLGSGWWINGHIGHLNFKNVHNGSYTDWKVGVTKDIQGWILGASYIGTNASGECSGASDYQAYCFTNSNGDNGAGGINFGSKTKDAGRSIAVISVSRTF